MSCNFHNNFTIVSHGHLVSLVQVIISSVICTNLVMCLILCLDFLSTNCNGKQMFENNFVYVCAIRVVRFFLYHVLCFISSFSKCRLDQKIILFEEDCENHEYNAFTTFSFLELSLNDDLDIELVNHRLNFETKYLQNYCIDCPKSGDMLWG